MTKVNRVERTNCEIARMLLTRRTVRSCEFAAREQYCRDTRELSAIVGFNERHCAIDLFNLYNDARQRNSADCCFCKIQCLAEIM